MSFCVSSTMVSCFRILILLSVLFVAIECLIKGKSGHEKRGVALLDDVTFSKVVPHSDISVMLLIWNEKNQGDYGSDSMVEDFCHFAAQAEFSGHSDNVLFAQLVVNTLAKHNLSVQIDPTMERYEFPRIFYFHPGDSRPVPYPQYNSINQIALNRFLGSATMFYLGTPGTQKDMYFLAKEFIAAADSKDAQQQILLKTTMTVDKLTNEMGGTWREFGGYYVKTMEKVIERGQGHLLKEIGRLEDLVSDQKKQISIEKRNELQTRINILHNFMTLDTLGITAEAINIEPVSTSTKVGMQEL